jgi:general secretion pathway protein E
MAKTTKTSKKAPTKAGNPKQRKAAPSKLAEHDLLTMPEAIKRLKTTRATFYRWLKAGKIQGVKVGRQWRFAREQIERFLRGEESAIDLTADLGPLQDQLDDRYRELTGRSFKGGRNVDTIVLLMIHLGAHMRASDIHITPQVDPAPQGSSDARTPCASVRLRVDGVLQTVATFDIRALPIVIDRWKSMAQCDVREHVRPQDGRITISIDLDDLASRSLDIRTTFLPAAMGEFLTARLLDRETVKLEMDKLGLCEGDLTRLRRSLTAPNGFILVTGPTGSGKTTTLYTCLNELAGPERKIVTVEDPVEYLIPGAVQIPVHPEGGRSFPVALRSALRSDPDVILAGEIRDLETLNCCFQLTLTGHLVLSTLHTRTATEGLERMINVGAEAFLVGATVRLAIAQRLVRRLCPECSQPYSPEGELLDRARDLLRADGLQSPPPPDGDFRKAVGCPNCARTGYRGRMTVVEMLEMTPVIDSALRNGVGGDELRAVAIGQGMTTMAADGVRKAAEGKTTLEEILRVLTF